MSRRASASKRGAGTRQNAIKPILGASEEQEQAALLAWWANYSKTRRIPEKLLFSIPNGAMLAGDARLRAIRMAILKRQGLRTGVPDLFLAVPSTPWHGLMIEMKRKSGATVSPDQRQMLQDLELQGYCCVTAYGADQAIQAIRRYLP